MAERLPRVSGELSRLRIKRERRSELRAQITPQKAKMMAGEGERLSSGERPLSLCQESGPSVTSCGHLSTEADEPHLGGSCQEKLVGALGEQRGQKSPAIISYNLPSSVRCPPERRTGRTMKETLKGCSNQSR